MNSSTLAPLAPVEEQNGLPAIRLAPAEFIGHQRGVEGWPPLELWNLTADIPGHCVGSTVSRQTLLKAGFVVRVIPPPAPEENIVRILTGVNGDRF